MKKNISIASLGLMLVLSACDGDADDGGAAEGETGGELNIAWNAQPPTMDPMITTANATRDIARNVFEQLVTLDAEGTPHPVLAEDFEISEDGQVLSFTLRDDVSFHDGSTMEAADVVASIERWIGLSGLGGQYFSGAEVDSPQEGVVTVTFAEPMPQAAALMAEQNQALVIMPAEVLEDAPDSGVEELIGTGPYELGEWSSDNYIRLDIFDDYVSPEGQTSGAAGEKDPYFENLYFRFVEDASTRVAGIQTGEYDVAFDVPRDNVDMLRDDDDLVTEVYESGYSLAILNKADGIMTDPLMREALLAITEPAGILEAAFTGEDFYEVGGDMVPEDSPLWVGVDREQFHDPDRSQQLLDEAGYDGEEVRLITTRDYEHLYNMSVVLQQQLEEAGVSTDMIVADWPTVTGELDSAEGWDIYIDSPGWRGLPHAHTHLASGAWGSPDDPELFASLDALLEADNDDAAYEASAQFHDAYYDYLPGVRFGNISQATVVRSEYEGFITTPTAGTIYYNMRPSE